MVKLPERLPARLPLILFGILALASVGAFYLTQHLKVQNPLINGAPRADPATINPRYAGVCPDAAGKRVSFRRTQVGFYLQSKPDVVSVDVHNAAGSDVATMTGPTHQLAVDQRALFSWNGRETGGRLAPAGTYTFYVVLEHEDRNFPITGVAVRVLSARPSPRVTGISVDQGTSTVSTATTATTTPTTPSFSPGRQQVTIHYRTGHDIGADVLVYRAVDNGTLKLVKTFGFGPHTGTGTVVWNGLIAGRPAPAGSYLIGLSVVDASCTTGRYPLVTDPAPGSTDGAGVNVSYLSATPPIDPVPAGQLATVAVQAGGAPYTWQLRLAGQSRVIYHGAVTGSQGAGLRVRLPGVGLYDLTLDSGARRTSVPLVASGVGRRAAAKVLVVLPALSWQGDNATDGNSDGLIDRISSGPIDLDRPLAAGLPADVADEAGLLEYLDSQHLSYDLTTDVALAQGEGPDLQGRTGVILDGTFSWLPAQIVNPLRGFVRAGGGVFAAGVHSLEQEASITGTGATATAGPAKAMSPDPFGVSHGTVSGTQGGLIIPVTDHLEIFTDVVALAATRFQVLSPPGHTVASVAGVSGADPAVIGFHLGSGTVVEAGLPDLGAELRTDVDAREMVSRIWQVVLR